MNIFKEARMEKIAYTLRGSSPEEWKTEIVDLFRKKYPFLSTGIKALNMKQEDEQSSSLVAELVVEYKGSKLIVPILVSDGELKSPDVAIIEDKEISVPIDESVLDDRISQSGEIGSLVKKERIMTNYEYLTQNGLFEGDESYSAKYASGEPVEAVYYEANEDSNIPYHYNVSFVVKTASGIDVVDSYCNASKLNGLKKSFKKTASDSEHKTISSETNDTHVVKKVTSSGKYDGVLIGDTIQGADIYSSSPFFGRDKGYSLVLAHDGVSIGYGEAFASFACEQELCDLYASKSAENDYVSIFSGSPNCPVERSGLGDVKKDTYQYFVVSPIGNRNFRNGGVSPVSELFESRGENFFTDSVKGVKVYTIKAKSLNDGEERFLVFGYPCGKVVKVTKDILKSLGYVFMSDEDLPYYFVPQGYYVVGFDSGSVKFTKLGEGKKHFRALIDKVASALTDRVSYSKEGQRCNFDISLSGSQSTLKGLSKTASLALMNYLLGENKEDISKYPEKETYLFKLAMPQERKRKSYEAVTKLKGDMSKLASYIKHSLPEALYKLADAESLVNDLVAEDFNDFKWEDESADVVNQMHKVLSKIAELLLMVRIGKVDVSESVLSRAMYALTSAIGEIKGDTGSNA